MPHSPSNVYVSIASLRNIMLYTIIVDGCQIHILEKSSRLGQNHRLAKKTRTLG